MAISVVQFDHTSAFGTTAAATLTNTPGPGNMVLVGYHFYSPNTFSSITDSRGHDWSATAITETSEPGGANTAGCKYNASISAGQATHAFTLTTGASGFKHVWAMEITGHKPASPLDVTVVNAQGVGTGAVFSSTTTSAAAAGNMLVIGCCNTAAGGGGSVSAEPAQAWTTVHVDASGDVEVVSKTASAAAGYIYSGTIPVADAKVTYVIVVSESAGSAGGAVMIIRELALLGVGV